METLYRGLTCFVGHEGGEITLATRWWFAVVLLSLDLFSGEWSFYQEIWTLTGISTDWEGVVYCNYSNAMCGTRFGIGFQASRVEAKLIASQVLHETSELTAWQILREAYLDEGYTQTHFHELDDSVFHPNDEHDSLIQMHHKGLRFCIFEELQYALPNYLESNSTGLIYDTAWVFPQLPKKLTNATIMSTPTGKT